MKADEIRSLIAKFDEIIDTLPAERKKQIEVFVEKLGARYFFAPASGSEQKHDAEPGGLLGHSLTVYKNLDLLCKLWFPSIPSDSIILSGLFHDLGKIGTFEGIDYYLPATQDWQLKRGIRYETNKKIPDGLTHAQRSTRLLAQCGIELSEDEYGAIMYHDGLYMEENIPMKRNYRQNQLLMALHWADYYTAFFDSERKD